MGLVGFEGVWKTYDETRWILQGIDLELRPGTLTLVMGRSGSGKTTLLNLAAGLEVPSKGTVWVDGKDVAKLPEEERTKLRLLRVGLVFQHYQLIPQLTVFENVRLPLRLAGAPDADERTRSLLESFSLTSLADDFPATLSGGEAQRTGIARALANKPTLLLADEPTANLDETNARSALSLLKDAAKKAQAAVLVASHDEVVKEYADELYRLKEGRLERAVPRPPPVKQDAKTAPPAPPTSRGATPAPRSGPSPAPPEAR